MFDYALFKRISEKYKPDLHHRPGFIKTEIADRLLDKLSFIKLEPKVIYIEGDFSHQQISHLKKTYPTANIIKQLMPKIDLILSNCQLHITNNIHRRLTQFHNALSANGVFLFTTFGSTTLVEAKKAWRFIDGCPHINQMLDMHDLGDILLQCQFQTPVIDAETLYFTYENIQTLLRDIRQLKEPLADTKMRKTLTGKRRWQQFVQLMKDNNYALSYEIVYGYANKNDKIMARKTDETTAIIDVDALQGITKYQARLTKDSESRYAKTY